MPALKSLDLSDNPLSPDSGAGLSALLHSCSHSLQRLVLTGTEIGDVGAAAMASQLAHLTALTHLDLSGCSITSVGAASIGAGLVAAQPVGLVLAEVLLTNNNLTVCCLDISMRCTLPLRCYIVAYRADEHAQSTRAGCWIGRGTIVSRCMPRAELCASLPNRVLAIHAQRDSDTR